MSDERKDYGNRKYVVLYPDDLYEEENTQYLVHSVQ